MKKQMLMLMVALLGLTIFVVNANAMVLDASGDTFIWGYSGQEDGNWGSLERFSLNTVAPANGSYSRGLVQFDLSAIATDQVVDGDVTLKLTLKGDNTSYHNFFLYESLHAWNENTVTWNSFSDNDAAGPTSGVDYSTDLLALYTGFSQPTQYGGPADGSVHSITISPEVVNGWISNPASNKGIYLAHEVIGATQSSGWLSFWSEEDVSGRGPVLEFTTIPEPATIGLLMLGSMCLRRKRK